MSTAGKVVAVIEQNVSSPTGTDTSKDVYYKRAGTVGLLPVRYALGDDKSRTPDVDGLANFKIVDSSHASRPKTADLKLKGKKAGAHYTLRTLRGGYLHVFVEHKITKKSGWAVFEVDTGHPVGTETDTALFSLSGRTNSEVKQNPVLKPLPLPAHDPKDTDTTPLQDAPVGYTEAGLLLLKDDTTVWLCFSDAPWTTRTLRNAQQSESARAPFMRKFDPKGLEQSWGDAKHVALLGEKGDRATALNQANIPPVAELTPGVDPKAFWFSRSPFRGGEIGKIEMIDNPAYDPKMKTSLNDRSPYVPPKIARRVTKGMSMKDVKTLGEPGSSPQAKDVKGWAALALEDPAGIAMDLGSMMQKRFEAWTKQPDKTLKNKSLEWVMSTSTAIAGIQESLENRAEAGVYSSDEERARAINDDRYLPPDVKAEAERSKQGLLAMASASQGQRASAARDKTWDPYRAKYHEQGHRDWMAQYKRDLEAFDREHILPLAEAFVAWADSRRMLNHFNGVFDSLDAGSGWEFTHLFQKCFTAVQDKEPIRKYLLNLMLASLGDTNLLGRSILLNHKPTLDAVQKAAEKQVDVGGLPWDGLIGAFNGSVLSYVKDKPDALMRLTQRILGPVAEAAMMNMQEAAIRPLLVALCVGSGTPLVTIEKVGNRQDFEHEMTRYLMQFHDDPYAYYTVKNAFEARMKEAGIKHGEKVKRSFRYRALANSDKLKRMPKGPGGRVLTEAEQADYLVRQVLSEEAALFRSGLKQTGVSAVGGMLACVFNYATLTSMLKELEGSLAQGKAELWARIGTQAVALAGVTLESLGKVMKGIQELIESADTSGTKFGGRVAATAEKAIWLGERASLGAGLVMAAVDFVMGGIALGKGKVCLGITYMISGGVTAGAALCFFYAARFVWAGPVGLLLVLCSIAVSLIINVIKDNPIQEWLWRCCWGKEEDERKRYYSMRFELEQLSLATAGAK